MNAALLRNRAIRIVRAFFETERLAEVRTNRLVPSAAMEPYIDAFSLSGADTTHRGYLATSPEFAMKKIFAAEIQSGENARGIYEIAPVFRDDLPGKHHGAEFTIIEWYTANSSLAEILTQCARLISHLAAEMRISDFNATMTQFSIIAELEKVIKQPLPVDTFPYIELYRSHFGELPHHVNLLDAEIASFNLLFDTWLLPIIREMPGLVAVSGYPACLAAMARENNGIAKRAEVFYNGLELANAYAEEFDADIIRARWSANNEIRRLRGVAEHAPDEALFASLGAMRDVSGIAVGLERLLSVFFPGIEMRHFDGFSA